VSSGVVGAAVVRHPTRVAVVETEERTRVVGALGVRLVPVEGSAFRVWSGAVVTRMAELRVIDVTAAVRRGRAPTRVSAGGLISHCDLISKCYGSGSTTLNGLISRELHMVGLTARATWTRSKLPVSESNVGPCRSS